MFRLGRYKNLFASKENDNKKSYKIAELINFMISADVLLCNGAAVSEKHNDM